VSLLLMVLYASD